MPLVFILLNSLQQTMNMLTAFSINKFTAVLYVMKEEKEFNNNF